MVWPAVGVLGGELTNPVLILNLPGKPSMPTAPTLASLRDVRASRISHCAPAPPGPAAADAVRCCHLRAPEPECGCPSRQPSRAPRTRRRCVSLIIPRPPPPRSCSGSSRRRAPTSATTVISIDQAPPPGMASSTASALDRSGSTRAPTAPRTIEAVPEQLRARPVAASWDTALAD